MKEGVGDFQGFYWIESRCMKAKAAGEVNVFVRGVHISNR